jgi:hypothetical protein
VTFVLDNSIAMRWCFENAAHPYADGILNLQIWLLRKAQIAGCRSLLHPAENKPGRVWLSRSSFVAPH